MTLSGIDKQTFDNMMDASAEILEIGKQQSKKTINYLIHTIMVLLDENVQKSKLEGNGKGANFTFFMAVNLCVLYVYRNEKFTTDDIIDMQKRYEDDFRHCRYLTDKSLSDREQLLYTIVAINVLSSAIACTAIPGVYLTERIYEDTFFENIFNMYVECNR